MHQHENKIYMATLLASMCKYLCTTCMQKSSAVDMLPSEYILNWLKCARQWYKQRPPNWGSKLQNPTKIENSTVVVILPIGKQPQ